MILDTDTIGEGRSTLQQLSDLALVKEDLPPFPKKVTCSATFERSTANIYVQVHFKGVFEQECARCLQTFLYPITGEINLILEEKEGRVGAAGEEETADYYFNARNHLVDISGAIFDEIMISLPLKPLCSDTCPGIITEQATITTETYCDPRWDALKKLKENR